MPHFYSCGNRSTKTTYHEQTTQEERKREREREGKRERGKAGKEYLLVKLHFRIDVFIEHGVDEARDALELHSQVFVFDFDFRFGRQRLNLRRFGVDCSGKNESLGERKVRGRGDETQAKYTCTP